MKGPLPREQVFAFLAAMETPELLAVDIREFFRGVR